MIPSLVRCWSVRVARVAAACAVWTLVSAPPVFSQTTIPDLEAEGPAQLLERGRAALAANDFAAAEEALKKFIADYGEAEEAKEAARLHRPLVAICLVGQQKFAEAVPWIDDSLADPKIEFAISDELRFWRGICLMTGGDLVAAQRAFGEYWTNENHQPFKRYEALLLFATLYLQQGFPAEAADFLADQLPKFRDLAPEAASRAVVLQLYARLEADQPTEALALIEAEFPRMAEMTQVISFQSLALQLGSRFLEEEKWYEAISCLQRIWPAARLLEYQANKVTEIEQRIAVLEARPNSQSTVFQLKSILKRVAREVEGFREFKSFDAALRLRLATAFQGLERYRESALILEDMLATMDPEPLVATATLAQLQCWMEIRRWPKAIEAAERYEEVFGKSGADLATVLLLKAEALRESNDHGAAQLAYGELVKQFPESPLAPKAQFMQGFLYLQQDDTDGALFQFEQVRKKYPKSDMVEDAAYWTGMGHSFAGLYAEARDLLTQYLEDYSKAKYGKEATFRIAVCTFSLAEYPEALALLNQFVEKNPGDEMNDEANLLIGDAYLGEGEIEPGFAAYEKVRPTAGRFFEEAWFKKGHAYKLLEEYDKMRAHFRTFVESYPDSARMPEAVYWVGWTFLNEDDIAAARDIYWETIDRHGNDAAMNTLTDVLMALPKVYSGPEGTEDLLTKLDTTKRRAASAGELVLAARAGWAKAQVLGKKHPESAQTELLEIAKWIDPKEENPLVSVDVAEALLAAGNERTGRELLVNTRKWHPRAAQRDRIYLALGDLAARDGDKPAAIGFYERFERETGASLRLAEVRLAKARLLFEMKRSGPAREALESVLTTETAPAALKAEALLALGQSYVESREHQKAIVYFERLYVVYGKFTELNARAYWARGQSLEKLSLGREALATYEEMVARDDLRRRPEVLKAAEKIVALRREFPAEEAPVTKEVSL